MEKLVQQFHSKIQSLNYDFKRYIHREINWDNRLIGIIGARGVGKTVFLLQHIKEQFSDLDEVIYISLDNIYFSKTSLLDFTDNFVKNGGKYLFIDEVHKYPDWSIEIKNIYDLYPDLHIVITGSSALNIHKGKGDLSRRIVFYKMNGLSLREFVKIKYSIDLPAYELNDILTNATEITKEINLKIKPLKVFNEYLKTGYYPFFNEGDHYFEKLEQTVSEIIETDLPSLARIDFSAAYKLKKLLMVVAGLVPFKPNILKLSKQIGINRETLLKYLFWLERADLLILLQSDIYGISKMNKPEKVYLNNPNLYYTLTFEQVKKGTLREIFICNQLRTKHKVFYTKQADFNVDNQYVFEVGGKNKKQKQIKGLENAYILADDIEFAYRNVIPVWLFGFLY